MGYTHYFYRKPKLNPNRFAKVVEDFKIAINLIRDKGIDICGWNGSGDPILNDLEIRFNGMADQSHETFILLLNYKKPDYQKADFFEPGKSKGLAFQFCKTAQKPYDLAVMTALVIAKHHLKDQIHISSDGEDGDWAAARDLCQLVFGYGADFKLGRGF